MALNQLAIILYHGCSMPVFATSKSEEKSATYRHMDLIHFLYILFPFFLASITVYRQAYASNKQLQ